MTGGEPSGGTVRDSGIITSNTMTRTTMEDSFIDKEKEKEKESGRSNQKEKEEFHGSQTNNEEDLFSGWNNENDEEITGGHLEAEQQWVGNTTHFEADFGDVSNLATASASASASLLGNEQKDYKSKEEEIGDPSTKGTRRKAGLLRRILEERRSRVEQERNTKQVQSFTFENARIEVADFHSQDQQQQPQTGFTDRVTTQEDFSHNHIDPDPDPDPDILNGSNEEITSAQQSINKLSLDTNSNNRPMLNWIRNRVIGQKELNQQLLETPGEGNQNQNENNNYNQIDQNDEANNLVGSSITTNTNSKETYITKRPVLNWIRKQVVTTHNQEKDTDQKQGSIGRATRDKDNTLSFQDKTSHTDSALSHNKQSERTETEVEIELDLNTSCAQYNEEEENQCQDQDQDIHRNDVDIVGPTRLDKPMDGFSSIQRPSISWLRNRTTSKKGGENKGLLENNPKQQQSTQQLQMDTKDFKSMSMANDTRKKEKVDTVCIWHDPSTGKSWL